MADQPPTSARALRRRWMDFNDRADRAASLVGRCMSASTNAWWAYRAAAWRYLADKQHERIKRRAGIREDGPRVTAADQPLSKQIHYAARPVAPVGREPERLTL